MPDEPIQCVSAKPRTSKSLSLLTDIAGVDAPCAGKRVGVGESVHALLDGLKIVPLARLVLDEPEPEAIDLGRRVEHELGDGEAAEWGKVEGWDWRVEFHAFLWLRYCLWLMRACKREGGKGGKCRFWGLSRGTSSVELTSIEPGFK
jgi:hypothetical protein